MRTGFDPVRWLSATLINGWVDHHAADVRYAPVGYTKDADGRVWLRGAIKSGASGTVAFVLPQDFWPVWRAGQSTYADNGATANPAFVQLEQDGRVIVFSTGTSFVSLNGLSFDTRR